MKKATSKILSALLIATLVFTSAGVAFADSGDSEAKAAVKATETKAAESNAVQFDGVKASVKDALTGIQKGDRIKKKSSGDIKLTKLKTGSEIPEVCELIYTLQDPALSGNYRGVVSKPIQLSKGTVLIQVGAYGIDASNTLIASGRVYYGVYKDAALTQPVDSYSSVTADGTAVSPKAFKIASSGTYYLGVYSNISASTTEKGYYVGFAAAYASGADRTLTNKKTIAVGHKDPQTNYFKFKATQTGYLTITESESSNEVALCNSKKKALSGYTSARYAPTYGVKKGTTYYIKSYAKYTNYDGGYTLSIKNNAISEKSGTKKSKAVTLKKNSTKKGTITAGSSQADWYKFKLTGKKSVKITVKGATNDELKIAVYQGSKQVIGSPQSFRYNTASRIMQSSGKWSKGTYYIKVYRGNNKSSGWYSLNWK